VKTDIIVVGVGGQGILTCSNILARASMNAGLNVLTSEVHGMAQRGGSVEVHVRIGDVYSPLIPLGSADFMIALEPVEALRKVEYLNEKSTVLMNTKTIVPITVTLGMAKYPSLDEIVESLKSVTENVVTVNALELAEKSGNVRAINVVMLGVLARILPLFSLEDLKKAVVDVLPKKLQEVNVKALEFGYTIKL
jgi:indolepyruvate ferredoxin oxidoreductase beta subunit